jgi:hypothetical protein
MNTGHNANLESECDKFGRGYSVPRRERRFIRGSRRSCHRTNTPPDPRISDSHVHTSAGWSGSTKGMLGPRSDQ